MFTGIVRESGKVRLLSGLGRLYKLSVESKETGKSAQVGDSIAVNGVCLTLTGKEKGLLHFDVMGETLKRTSLAKLRYGDTVNMEEALKAGGSLGGHFVTGHIDCVGRIKEIKRLGGDLSIEITFPEEHNALVVEKGSIALDGISLTIGKALKKSVIVYVIPHTLKVTTLDGRKAGDELNIEFDVIGKYVAKLVEKSKFS